MRYLETFDHTVAVMQRAEDLRRVAAECAEDLAADGVVYAEVRYAPEQHLDGWADPGRGRRGGAGGLRGRDGDGAAAGQPDRGHASSSPRCGTPPTRGRSPSWRCATATTASCGFDIAGAEIGFPPTRHLNAFEYLQRENAHFTIHAGEAFGLPSIWEALQWCGAERLGHGVRIVDDIDVDRTSQPQLGRLAAYVRDRRVPLEMCPSSNLQTGAAASIAEHPIGLLTAMRFRVTVNTDNRLMSGTTMSREMELLVEAFGYDFDDLRWFTINAMKSAFLPVRRAA